MSRTLIFSFADSAIASARVLFHLGRTSEALHRLQAVLQQKNLSLETAFAGHRLAGEIALDAERYALARKHFRRALRLSPGDAESYFHLGLAQQQDPLGSDYRAARCFRKALSLAADRADIQAAYGLALIRCRKVAAGLKNLRHAFEKAPQQIFVLERLVDGFIEARRPEQCRPFLTQARFLGVARTVIEQLQARLQFEEARIQQQKQKRRFPESGGILPFLRVAAESTTVTGTSHGGVVRRDSASWACPHFGLPRQHRAEPG